MSSVEYQRTYYNEFLRAHRGYEPRVERGPASAHIARCRDLGMSIASISARSGVPEATIREAISRPQGRMLTITAQSILSVRPQRPVTAIGVTRRIRALNALGWSTTVIARMAGLNVETVKRWRRAEINGVNRAVAGPIVAVYDELSMRKPQPITKQDRIGVTRAANEAARAGWFAPLAWDEDAIDDPCATPDPGERTRGVDLDEWLYIVRAGEEPNRAAARLGVQITAIERAAHRASRPDIAAMASSARIREEKAS